MEDVCRVCLADDREMYRVTNTALEQTYDVITGDKLQRAGRPTALCSVCVSQLRRCSRFIDTARESNAAMDRWCWDHTYTDITFDRVPELGVSQEAMEPDDGNINEDNELAFLTEEIEYEVTLDYVQTDPTLVSHDEKDSTQLSDAKKVNAEMSDDEDNTQYSSIKSENSVINECVTVPLTDGPRLEQRRTITARHRSSNTDTASTPRLPRKSFSCPQCPYTTTGMSDLKRHATKHTGEKPFACDQCDYKCTRNNSLKRHLLSHTGEKPFACDKCDYKGISKMHLKRHIMIHTGEKPFICNKCDYKCNKMSNLKIHLMVHSSEKPFACDKCYFKCKQKSNLKMHILTHTGEKPFACDKCDYKCSKKSHLQKHLMVHTGEKPFACDKCDYKCNVKAKLKRHSIIHNKNRNEYFQRKKDTKTY